MVDEPRVYYFISDHLGTGQLLVDANQQLAWQGEAEPFGATRVVIDQLGNNLRFPGQNYDFKTGLHYNWHRYYDPSTGRYISADPIGLAGGINLGSCCVSGSYLTSTSISE
ncbi:RHS repeat-associated core domain-containing protein [Desulfogranum mediterraneum]|uniref:RHS repeat-associated core domain-containing protein n=1 Tax=Desulfogranum mediterraneum TaxID=160661 RepID=UPI0038B7F055